MKDGFVCITAILGGVIAFQLASAGITMRDPSFWSILGTSLALAGVFYKWGDSI
jgi:hypothetical protein